MNEEKKRKRNHKKKVICSICLNTEPEDEVNQSKTQKGEHTCPTSCPICKKIYDINHEKLQNNAGKGREGTQRVIEIISKDRHTTNTKTKSVQTANSDSKSMILLNEVLAEFQSKKTEKSKTAKLKDASVSTNHLAADSKLSVNKVFQISIDPNKAPENERFIVISSNTEHKYNFAVHKSSSIPQTQLEQLKHSLKVKHRSKDVIEEVNRMFATVNRHTKDEEINRPSIRSGPKVLPVVQTIADFNKRKLRSPNLSSKCCQINCLSSGDSQCCHIEDANQRNCEKCVFMMTCNYKNHNRIQTGMMICERCRTEVPWKSSRHSFDS